MGLGIDLHGLRRRDECLHESEVEVASAGLRRVVCETCSHVKIEPTAELSGDIDRSRFGRRPDRSGGRGVRAPVDETSDTNEPVKV